MKYLYTLLLMVLASTVSLQAATNAVLIENEIAAKPELSALAASTQDFSIQDFLVLTPKQYRKMTGERLGIKGTLALKAAQRAVRKNMESVSAAPADSSDMPKGAYVALVILGLGFIPMGIMDDWSGNNWWMNLILSVICWIPGVIHGLVKMKEYY